MIRGGTDAHDEQCLDQYADTERVHGETGRINLHAQDVHDTLFGIATDFVVTGPAWFAIFEQSSIFSCKTLK